MENTPEIKEVKPKKDLLKLLVIVETFTIVLLAGLLIYQNFSDIPFLNTFNADTTAEDENTDTDVEESKNDDSTPIATVSTFTGTYVSAELPLNWDIVEYTDNTGSNMIMDGTTYSGLVGLKVFNENDVEMFYLKAVDGIGGTEGCETVYEFSDSDQAYLDHGNDWTLATGVVPTTVVDLTNSTYTEYDLLGWEVRRIGSDLYRNMNANLPGFNPACGIDVHLSISNLAYNRIISGGTTSGNTYYMDISNTVDTTQLVELDAVLESLVVN